jgi:predicted TIM-barrel fold metal-dependent hydrolase
MVIIDAHCHLWEAKILTPMIINWFNRRAKRWGGDPSLLIDGTADRLIREMDEAGIDKSVVLALDYEFVRKEGLTGREYNDYVSQQFQKYPDRLIGFCGIDPRRGKGAIRELERCVGDLGFRGVKLWPLTGFYPDYLAFYPFYELLEELGVPVLCHTGRGPPNTYLKHSQPVYVDTIAVDFPRIPIIMAHMGIPWTQEAIGVAAKNPNVYVDISSLQRLFNQAPATLFRILSEAKQMCNGVRKILFGSDWPLFTPLCTQPEWVAGISTLTIPQPLEAFGLPDLTEEDKQLILGGNAQQLLKI